MELESVSNYDEVKNAILEKVLIIIFYLLHFYFSSVYSTSNAYAKYFGCFIIILHLFFIFNDK